jgi:KUP system potassium uptake protein
VATIGALVFGDIGTSPIYTVQTIFNPGDPSRSLPGPRVCTDCCPWTLVGNDHRHCFYVGLVLRADNEGEGGILSLITLLSRGRRHRHKH